MKQTTTIDILAVFAPFFSSTRAGTDYAGGNYACLLCAARVDNGATEAVSFSGTTKRWAHVACLQAKGGVVISDKKAKARAQAAFKEWGKAARAAKREQGASVPMPTDHVCPTVTPVDTDALRASITAEIEAEYDEIFQEAVDTLNDLRAQVARLTAERDALKAASAPTTRPTAVKLSKSERRAALVA